MKPVITLKELKTLEEFESKSEQNKQQITKETPNSVSPKSEKAKQPKGKLEQLKEKFNEVKTELAKSVKEAQDSITDFGMGEYKIDTTTDL
jgi:hypothetical protein